MSKPGEEYARIAEPFGIVMSPELFSAAAAVHERLRPQLEELRRVDLSFLEPIEPAHAVQWLQRGGVSMSSQDEGLPDRDAQAARGDLETPAAQGK